MDLLVKAASMRYLILVLLLAQYSSANEQAGTRGGALKEDSRQIEELSCYEPNPEPIIGVHDSTRILNVGLAKVGTTSLFVALAQVPNRNATHNTCLNAGMCGECIKEALDHGRPPLTSCANTWAYAQMEAVTPDFCFFPQVTNLDDLYEESPNATFILPFRPTKDWINSINHFYEFRRYVERACEFPIYDFHLGSGKSDAELDRFFCEHVKHIRQYVKDHPSLSLIEYHIYDDNVGTLLEKYIPDFDAKFWGQYNINPFY